MGTRAVYTFKDASWIVHVYKHFDGYPEGAAGALIEARKKAWEAPRFEADEFAAAFVAANKDGGGNIRLIGALSNAPDAMVPPDRFAGDTEYLYEITGPDHVIAYEAVGDGKRAEKPFYIGTFEGIAKAKSE